ncbi:MAG TPA: 3-deoxy-7-phosphoheptulonate synthase, partial [Myxococcota bacterium]|nr:3-deoxy-7-phosphoheptulonate synthase [Myxococcota bacterium]
MTRWSPSSWRGKVARQLPRYPDDNAVTKVLAQLASYPPVIFSGEARALKAKLANVSRGKAFLLQGGDCA